MYGNNLDADKLGIRDLVGEPTGNALINWVKGLGITGNYLVSSPNANGSIDIDLNFALVANTILSLVERLAGEFKATIDGSKLTVTGGHVFLPDRAYILTDYTRNLTDGDAGDCLCINLTASSASYAWTAMPSTGIVTDTGATLPLCRSFKSNNKWYVQHLHIGAYVLPFPPATIIAGYDESKVQALTHQAAGLVWGDYCPDCSDSSSSASASSSSGSSSSGSGSGSSSSASGSDSSASDSSSSASASTSASTSASASSSGSGASSSSADYPCICQDILEVVIGSAEFYVGRTACGAQHPEITSIQQLINLATAEGYREYRYRQKFCGDERQYKYPGYDQDPNYSILDWRGEEVWDFMSDPETCQYTEWYVTVSTIWVAVREQAVPEDYVCDGEWSDETPEDDLI